MASQDPTPAMLTCRSPTRRSTPPHPEGHRPGQGLRHPRTSAASARTGGATTARSIIPPADKVDTLIREFVATGGDLQELAPVIRTLGSQNGSAAERDYDDETTDAAAMYTARKVDDEWLVSASIITHAPGSWARHRHMGATNWDSCAAASSTATGHDRAGVSLAL